jgi:hypothetical protein
MRLALRKRALWLTMPAAFVLLFAGCGQSENRTEKVEAKKAKPVVQAESKHNYKGRDWCAEHGVPVSTCSMCSAKVAAECKKKGDWCDKHDRALSQCFICNPKLKEKFAAEYRAQYGEDPPPIEDEAH